MANDPNDQNKTDDAAQGPGPAPGESNARAVRNTDKAAADKAGAGASSSASTTDTGTNIGTTRVRMTRDDGTRKTGEIVDLPAAEAQRLIDSGAAQRF